jgi:hypothetical protein
MTSGVIDLEKHRVSEREIIDISIDFMFDGRSTSECRGYLLSEYDLDARDLDPLLERSAKCRSAKWSSAHD